MGTNINKQGIAFASGNINPNLMPNSYIMPLGTASYATGTWRVAGSSTMTKSRVLIENGMYGLQNVGIQTPNDGSCYGIDGFPLEGNTNYIISMWARIVSGTEAYAGYNVYNATDVGGSYTKIDKNYRVTPLSTDWTRCWYEFKTNSATSRNIYIGITTGDTDVTTQMCLIKIEKGSILTPWSPYSTDDIYVGATSGFMETLNSPNASISKEYMEATQFYEV